MSRDQSERLPRGQEEAMTRLRKFCQGLVIVVAALVAVPSLLASAAPPEQSRGEYSFSDTIPAEECGFPIQIEGSGTFHEIFRARNDAPVDVNGQTIPYAVMVHIKEQGTYSANGQTLDYSVSATFQDLDIVYLGETDVVDPISGETLQGALFSLNHFERGIPIKISLPGGKQVSVDAGNIAIEDVLIVRYFDANGDLHVDVLSEGTVTVHGPHPLFRTDGFCEIMNQYLAA
jgi:hypothetical protein